MSGPQFAIDLESLLVAAPGAATLAEIEAAVGPAGLTLGVDHPRDASVGDWLARGAPGAPSLFSDPADHVVAGLVATLADGRRLEVRPSPRRAVGPDLVALFVGAGDRFGRVELAWLRLHARHARKVALPLPALDLDPPVSEAESRLVDAIASALAR